MNAQIWSVNNVDLLLSTPLFSICTAQDKELIRRFIRHRNLMSQEVLFWQNDACEAFYFLLKGYIKLCRRVRRTERILGFVEPGQIFAESAVYAGSGYPYTGVATEDSELIVIQAYPFTRFLYSRPQLASRFIAHISHCLHRQLQEREQSNTHNAEQRVAAYLLSPYAGLNPEITVRRMPGRRLELANLLNMTPETLSRTLKRFKDAHWIEQHGDEITVIDPAALCSLLPE